MDDTRRAYQAALQGLDGSLEGVSAHDVLARAGWMRSVGGAGPYLCLHGRAGLSRAAIDAAVAGGDICELPSARGCTYVVPRSDYAVALRLGQGRSEATEIAAAKKLGVTDAELERLYAAVLDALVNGPLDPKGLKNALGDRVRSLDEAGKKKGLGTTLGPALGWLQSRGHIRRIPMNGRLDSQRFSYARWSPSPLEGVAMDDDVLARAVATRYYAWIGIATLDQLAWWSGLSKRTLRAAVADLGIVPIAPGSEELATPEARDAAASFAVPGAPDVRLVGSLDNLLHLRRELAPLVHPDDADARIAGGGFTTIDRGDRVSSVLDLSHHAIVDRGRLVGVWDFDADAGEVVARLWTRPAGAEEAIRRTERFVREDLGDARAFSLDAMHSTGRGSRADRLSVLRSG